MPELPEVEVIRRGLLPYLKGRTITDVHGSGKPLRHPVPLAAMKKKLPGLTLLTVSRRAKYLVIRASAGIRLVIHLGMTGNLGVFPASAGMRPHDHLCWQLDNTMELRLNDSRRFGGVWLLLTDKEEKEFFRNTGPEPFSRVCSPSFFMDAGRHRRQAIKTLLMDGRVVAGIGNIYANEALFAARIHPGRPACSLNEREWKRLVPLLRSILIQAIACGGSTISDFINASGNSGYFQMNFQIYGRQNQPCHTCGTPIAKIVISGRASYFCPHCQKE